MDEHTHNYRIEGYPGDVDEDMTLDEKEPELWSHANTVISTVTIVIAVFLAAVAVLIAILIN